MFKKLFHLFVGALVILPTVAVMANPASAATVNVDGVTLDFTASKKVHIVGTDGTAAGNIVKYTNVATVSGIGIDAVVQVVSFTGITRLGDFDEPGQGFDDSNTADAEKLFQLSFPNNPPAGGVKFRFSFYESGTYTGVGTGIPVTLTNVRINVYDLDAEQYAEFSGFQKSKIAITSNPDYLGASTVAGSSPVRTRFSWGSSGYTAGSNRNGSSYDLGRLEVFYSSLTTIETFLGDANGQGAVYGMEWGVGPLWPDSTSDAAFVNNALNAPPASNDSTLNVASGLAHPLSRFDFGTFSDPDGNPWVSTKILSLPAGGTLEYLNGASWAPVTASQVFTYDQINLGQVRYTAGQGTTSDSFTFAVGDGLDFSNRVNNNTNAQNGVYALDLTVVASPQEITFANPNAKAPSTTFASNATSNSTNPNLPVDLISNSTGVCTVSGLDITTITSGTCSITAIQDGNGTFAAAQPVTQEFAVSSLTPQTITFANPGNKNVSGTFSISPTSTSALAVTVISLTPSICTVSNGTVTTTSTAGTCTLRASQAGNGTIAPASNVSQSFQVIAVALTAQTITFAAISDATLATPSTTVAPTASSGLTVTLTSTTLSTCTVSGFVITHAATGTCSITASQAGNSNYSAATSVTRTFNIAAAPVVQNTYEPFKPEVTPIKGSGKVDQPVSVTPKIRAEGNSPALCLVDPADSVCKQTVTVAGVGTFTLSNGSVTFTPVKGFVGEAKVVLRATDAYGQNDDETLTFAIAVDNDTKPTSVTDPAIAISGQTTNRKALDIDVTIAPNAGQTICIALINATECNPSKTQQASVGSWSIDAAGQVKFVPNTKFVGTATAEIRVYAANFIRFIPMAVTVTKRPPVTITIGNFIDGSPKITADIAGRIKAFVKKYADYRTIECIGYTEGPTVLKTDKALSKARATNACNYVSKTLKKSYVKLPLKSDQDTVENQARRRVVLTLRD